MRKISPFPLIMLMLLIFSVATAQDVKIRTVTTPEASFGIFGGVNFQNLNGKDPAGDELSNSLVPRFHLGIVEEIPIAPEFYAHLGLQYISKGAKGSKMYIDNTGAHEITREVKINYFELYTNLAYKPVLGEGYLLLGFGPYVGYSSGGKAVFTGDNAPSDSDLDYQKSVPDGAINNLIYYKRMDVGANFFFGYEMASSVYLIFNSQLGLVNINSDTDSDLAEKNTGFGLSVGYRF